MGKRYHHQDFFLCLGLDWPYPKNTMRDYSRSQGPMRYVGWAGHIIPIDYIKRVQRQAFWVKSSKTPTMLNIPKKFKHKLIYKEEVADMQHSENDVLGVEHRDPVTGTTSIVVVGWRPGKFTAGEKH